MRRNVIAAGLGVLLVFGTLGSYFYFEATKYYRSSWRRIGNPIYVRDSELGFTLGKRISVLNPGRFEFTDDRGIRVKSRSEQGVGRADVLVAGCSFAYGLGVPQEVTFSGLVEKLSPGLRVANLGVSGYGTVPSRARSLQYLDLKPQIVVYSLIDEHINRNFTPCAADGRVFCRPMLHLERNGEVRLPSSLFSLLSFGYVREVELDHEFGLNDVKWEAAKHVARLFRATSSDMNEVATKNLSEEHKWAALGDELERWRSALAANRAHLLVAHIPNLSRPQSLAAPGLMVIQKLLSRPGFSFLDLGPRLASDSAGLCLAPHDCHPSKKAHLIIAKEMLRAMAPVSKKVAGSPSDFLR